MAELKSLQNIPSIYSTDQDWIEWHKKLRKDTGKLNANDLFMRAWRLRKNEDAIFGSSANTASLRDYLSSEGLKLSGDGAFGFAYDALDDIEDWASSAFNTTKWVFIAIIAAVLIPMFILMLNVAKNPNAAIGAVSGAYAGGALKK